MSAELITHRFQRPIVSQLRPVQERVIINPSPTAQLSFLEFLVLTTSALPSGNTSQSLDLTPTSLAMASCSRSWPASPLLSPFLQFCNDFDYFWFWPATATSPTNCYQATNMLSFLDDKKIKSEITPGSIWYCLIRLSFQSTLLALLLGASSLPEIAWKSVTGAKDKSSAWAACKTAIASGCSECCSLLAIN